MPEIRWKDWNKESFETARSEGKPILLDIFGSWCHWCHVMDHTSYSDPVVIDLVNKNFVPVRVDTDKRPDVNRRYNMGGWPSTVFLDSDGRIITGGTYIPPGQMREALRSVTDLYQRTKGRVRSKIGPPTPPRSTGEELSETILKDIATNVAVNFDIDYGGFGFEPKFPHTDAMELALLRYHFNGEKEMLTVASRTLDRMGKGGVYDQVEDGFFRYSTTRDWSIPHFEKMAEDNARLLSVYLKACKLTNNPFYKQVAEGIVRYVENHLTDLANPGFYGSQDADEEYYKLGLENRKKRKSVPKIDKTKYANYNALVTSSFLLAGTVLNRKELIKLAITVFDNLLGWALVSDGEVRHYEDESAPRGLLVDQVLMTMASLDVYDQTGDRKYRDVAAKVLRYTLSHLRDNDAGGFYDVPSGQELGELKTRDKPLDENSLMAIALMRLSHVTSDPRLFEEAERTLKLFTSDYERYGLMAASYGVAIDYYLNGPVGLTVVGPQDSKQVEAFRREALNVYPARRAILYLDPTIDKEQIKTLGYAEEAPTVAYACIGKVCGPPLRQPSHLTESVSNLLKASMLAPPATAESSSSPTVPDLNP